MEAIPEHVERTEEIHSVGRGPGVHPQKFKSLLFTGDGADHVVEVAMDDGEFNVDGGGQDEKDGENNYPVGYDRTTCTG